MGRVEELASVAFKKMSLLETAEAREALSLDAKKCTVGEWRRRNLAKTGGVGGLTGVVGGPVGLALEGADLAYLLAAGGRACYGIGHILNREIDYENDIPLILAIWSDVATTASTVGAGKVGIKVSAKVGMKATSKVVGKVLSKMAFKGSTKASSKVAAKAAAKLIAKSMAKLSTKWIPIIGGLVSGGVNVWVISGLIKAAEQYYSNDYVVLDDEIFVDVD